VRALKLVLDPSVRAYDKIAGACTELTTATRLAWDAYALSWRAFFDSSEGFWTAGAEYDQALAFQTTLNGWGSIFSARCGLAAPVITPSTNNDTTNKQGITDTLAAIKPWLIGGAVAVAVAGGLYVATEIKALTRA
jgi:hypothetical protein